MIVVKDIHYQNFMGAGAAPVRVNLTETSTTLIVGVNGAGKSTMNEAISMAWFGKPLRDVNKPQLVNAINERDCLVVCNFETQGQRYMVKRGMKPTVFEIYKNDELIKPPASSADYQTMLEKDILRMNHKSFMQIVILGNASYVPFMRLNPAGRRQIIEDLLDIEVFSVMSAMTKDDATKVKSEIGLTDQKTNSLADQIRMAEDVTEHLEIERQKALQTVSEDLQEVQTTIRNLEYDRSEKSDEIDAYEDVRDAYDKARAKLREYEQMVSKLEDKSADNQKTRRFYEKHDQCPTCEQSITPEFKAKVFSDLKQSEYDVTRAIDKCQSLIRTYESEVSEHETSLEAANALGRLIAGIDAKLPIHKRRKQELEREHARLSVPTSKKSLTLDVDALQLQLDTLRSELTALSHRRTIIDAAALLLKDNGIKTRIINHYLPVINRLVNSYLTAMEFPVHFTLDEEFNEQILSENRHNFSYNLFSEGEKKRIDLALLFTWRAIAKLKNSADVNLLIFDEVFDGSLDTNGLEEFWKIIQNLEPTTNVFVISHKTEADDKFDRTITFEKVRGFSRIKDA